MANERVVRPDLIKVDVGLHRDVLFLPYEMKLLDDRIARLLQEWREASDLKAEAMEQSSETFHDNAPMDAAVAEGYVVSFKLTPLQRLARMAKQIEYPNPDSLIVAIGSRVLVKSSIDEFEVDVVGGDLLGRKSVGDTETTTYVAPLGAALLSCMPGDEITVTVNERNDWFTIVSVDQTGQFNDFDSR